jgi:hypothetical protein
MDEKVFSKLCKKVVVDYANKHLDKSDGKKITENDVFVVWMCKTLQNNKALVSTTLFDGMYYELTYNGDENELYFDAYKKWENQRIEIACRNCANANRLDEKTIECLAEEYDIKSLSCFTPK